MRTLSLEGQAFRAVARSILARGDALRFRARGASMRPFIRDGDLVEVRPLDERSIRRGDVVLCCDGGGRLLVHRVIRRLRDDGQTALVTRGDALVRDDGVIARDDVLGRVVRVERSGRCVGPQRLAGLLWMSLAPWCRRVRSGWITLRRCPGAFWGGLMNRLSIVFPGGT